MPAKKTGNAADKAKPHYHGHRDRLRKRFQDAGAQALADYELLELVLFRAIPMRDVAELTKATQRPLGLRRGSSTICRAYKSSAVIGRLRWAGKGNSWR